MKKEQAPRGLSEIIRPQRKLSEIIANAKEFPFDARRKEELRTDRQAFLYVKERFKSSLGPLAESYGQEVVLEDSLDAPVRYRRLEEFEKQRQLSGIEKEYFTSTELLSRFGDYLVALARADFAKTSVYIQEYFERLSKSTAETLKDGAYFPLTIVGFGPHSLIAMGEIIRKNPRLAAQTLVIDAGDQPGGPFAVANGPAWELNSANLRGRKMLPDAPGDNEEKTVRSYGSPERWYPGERTRRKRKQITNLRNYHK